MIADTGPHTEQWLKTLSAAALACALWLFPSVVAANDDNWPALQRDVFGDREVIDDGKMVLIDAPERAEDAAIVPITMRIPPSVTGPVKTMTLIIDNNPAPVAATFTFGPAAGEGGGERRMSTRVRIDSYSHVRAIVETSDGKLHMSKVFVKASGGCSAPAPKDIDGASADLGKIVARTFDPALDTTALREAQIRIRHPNFNGLQLDPVTRGYTPARFIRDLTVKRGDDLVFRLEGTISISSDPNFRFTYANAEGSNDLEVTAVDTDETVFKGGTVHKGL